MQGHVEGVGTVESRSKNGELTIVVPKDLITYCVQKGSLAIEGVSLTIASRKGDRITVALVPHTLENTTLGSLEKGESVNLETDVIGRYVHTFLTHDQSHSLPSSCA